MSARVNQVFLLQELDPAPASPLQHLPVKVFPVPEGGFGLLVNSTGWRYPEGQAGLPVQPLQRGGGQQSLAPARRHLEADVRDGPPGVVRPAGVLSGGLGHAAGLRQMLPGALGVVADVVGDVGPHALERGYGRLRLGPRLRQRVAPADEGLQCGYLVVL